MKRAYLLVIGFLLLFFNQGAKAQDPSQLPAITPPSPTAFELGKFGEIPVGMFNGSPNMNIPLYTYSTKYLSVPISLSYSNSGIRVDQLSSWVGLGWNLNIGGVITRTTRGSADEFNGSPQDFPDKQIDDYITSNSLSNVPPVVSSFIFNQADGTIDGEHDIYNFNFQGASGRFVIDGRGKIALLNHSAPVKITSTGAASSKVFTITAPDGVAYEFSAVEITRNENSCAGGNASNPPLSPITAWYLKTITHPFGDQITFNYTNYSYRYTVGKTQSLANLTGEEGTGDCSCPADSYSNCDQVMTVTGLRLSGISSNNPHDGVVSLQSNLSHPEVTGYKLLQNIQVKDQSNTIIERFDLSYNFTANDRSFLQSVRHKDPNQRYEFEYKNRNSFPARLTYGQDHWGFYNGVTNNSNLLIRPNHELWNNVSGVLGADREINSTYTGYGLLEKVTYPTGGHTNLIYEPNTYYGEKPSYTDTTHQVNTDGTTGFSNSVTFTTSTNYQASNNYSTTITGYSDLGNFNCNGCTGTGTITLTDLTTNQTVVTLGVTEKGSVNHDVTLEKNHSYRLTITTNGGGLHYLAQLRYYDMVSVQANHPGPGMRVQKTEALDPISGQTTTMRYYYAKMDNLSQSSGRKWLDPDYLNESRQYVSCGVGVNGIGTSFKFCYYSNLSSNTATSIVDQRGSMIYYPYVTTSIGGDNFEAGAMEYEYIINQLSTNRAIWGSGEYSQPIFVTNQDAANNGMEKKMTSFKKETGGSFTRLYEKENVYVEDTGFRYQIPNYVASRILNIAGSQQLTPDYVCSVSDTSKRYPYRRCMANHDHFWKTQGDTTVECIADGHNNQTVYVNHPCYGRSTGTVLSEFDQQPIVEYVDMLQYDHVSERYYMEESTERFYDEDGLNPVEKITKYYYDNPLHLQVTRTEVTDSRTGTLVSKVYYPDDVADLAGLSIPQKAAIEKLGLTSQHRLAQPIQSETYRDGVLLSTQRTLFKDWGNNVVLPEQVHTQKGTTNTLEDRLTYHSYDDNGNPLEVSRADGARISYIWGYNKKFPIAKIENASYAAIATALGISVAILKTYNESNLTAIETLRSSLPTAMISTYVYNPLVGVTSMTDPSGYTMSYEYDQYNRLKRVKDQDGNIVSENEYHYKGTN